MIVIYVLYLVGVLMMLTGALIWLFDGSKLQPSYKETLLRHAEEQHAAIMNGDDHFGIYGNYPPAKGVNNER